MLKLVNRRDLLLGVLFLGAVVLTFGGGMSGWLRAVLWLSQFSTGNVHDIALGILVSLLIYFLVVRLPEIHKGNMVRRNLQMQYDSFRGGSIRVFVNAIGQGYDSALIDHLNDQRQFRDFFSETFHPGQTRWDAVANGLRPEDIDNLVAELDIFTAEVRFTLNTVDVENEEIFAFLKRLANALYRAKNCSCGYDGVKSLLSLMWSVFTGWDFAEGYPKKDSIAEMIGAI